MYPPPFLFLKEKKQKNFNALRGLVVDLAEATATKRRVPCVSSFHRLRFEFRSKFSDTCMITEASRNVKGIVGRQLLNFLQ
jgi:hypothetical protein